MDLLSVLSPDAVWSSIYSDVCLPLDTAVDIMEDPFGLDDDGLMPFIHRINSEQIIYQSKKKECKFIGRYVMGDLLGKQNKSTLSCFEF